MKPPVDGLAGLHVLADDATHWKWDPVEQAGAACAGGAAVVQLRVKHATDRQAIVWGRAIREATRRSGALFIVNDRFDLALAVGADGVHVGQGDVPPGRLPLAVREQLLVGRSTHTAAQLDVATAEPADYLAFGPVFGTRSKASEYEARGLGALGEAAVRAAPRPLIAIGGLGAEHARSLRAAGAAGFAVISAVAGADDPEAAAGELVRAWRAAA